MQLCHDLPMNRMTLIILAGLAGFFAAHTHAATATFANPDAYTTAGALALSADDGETYTVARDSALELVTDIGFATSAPNDSLAVFTALPSPFGLALGRIEVGVFQNGVSSVLASTTFFSGQQIIASNLFGNQCDNFGGCNFLRIVTLFDVPQDEGVRVDYITIDGQVVHVSAPAPEPEVWVLMILGFWAVAFRLKQVRRRAKSAAHSVAPDGLAMP